MLPEERWKVTVYDVKTHTEKRYEYDAVMICNGHNSKISMPDIPGMSDFQGVSMHSKIYRIPDPFAGKRVLVVGGGPSGCDIAVKLLNAAKKVLKYMNYVKSFKGEV